MIQEKEIMMDIQKVDKSIKQMRQMFGFMTALFGILAVIMIFNISNSQYAVGYLFLYGILSFCFYKGYGGAGRRDPGGLKAVKMCSVVFLFLFPVLTIFGISYLNKLSKPEMKQAFGVLGD
jgi:hypothetical protein